MSTIVRTGQDRLSRRSEVGRIEKSVAKPIGQPKRFGAVLEKVQTEDAEPHRPCFQGKVKPKNQRAADSSHAGSSGERDSTSLLSSFPPWMRAEGAVRPEEVQTTSPGPRNVVAPRPDRVLVGVGGSVPEARVRIGEGPLAGTEIQLVAVPGGVEARVLTVHEASRQTLSVAMDEIAHRLRRKGHSLLMNASEGRGQRRDIDANPSHPSDE